MLAALLLVSASRRKRDRHAGLDAEHVVLGARELGVGADVAARSTTKFVELLRHDLAEAVEGAAFDEAAVGDEGEDAVVVEPVGRPAEEAGIHVVELGLLRGRCSDVGRLDALVDRRVVRFLLLSFSFC